MKTLWSLTLAAFLALVTPLAAQADARSTYLAESRLMDEEIVRYAGGRGREVAAVTDLQTLSESLDELLGDPHAHVGDITRLETQVAAARDRACTLSAENAASRQRLYDRMRRLVSLAQTLEDDRAPDLLGPGPPISGLWKVEAQPTGNHGLMSLHLEGTVVSGTFRLSNGAKGSVQGTYTGDRLEAKLIEVEDGFIGTVTGVWDSDAGTIEGQWQSTLLNANRPAAGTWEATKVSPEEEAELLQ